MRVNQVVVIPAFTNSGALGRYCGKTCEYDAVNAYVESLCEFLDHDRIRFELRPPDSREPILPNSLILHCSVGWNKKDSKSKNNHSVVSYAQSSSKKFAEILLETVSEWGKCYADLGHKCKENDKDRENILLRYIDTFSVSIEPFRLNGPNPDEYMRGAPTLGRMLAQAIFEFLASRNEQPTMMSAYK